MIKKFIYFSVFLCLVMASGLWAADNPEAVSPGSDLRATVIDQVCPTFSWAQVPGASAYQIAVFEMSERFEGLSYYENQAALSQPVLIKKISGSATSWTPSLEEALSNGGCYVWFVMAQDAYGSGTWSVGKKFTVRAPIGLSEIKEKLKRQLEAKGVKGDLVDEAFDGIGHPKEKAQIGGEIKGKEQSREEKEVQEKVKTQANKEIRSKENPSALGTSDFTAGALGSEGDAGYNVYYGIGTDNSLPGTANYNSFFGYQAGYSNDSGDYNTFLGYKAGYSNTSGNYNTFIGNYAGYDNTSANYNTFIGKSAGSSNTTAEHNTFVGYQAGYLNTTGTYNCFFGDGSGYSNTTGFSNIFIGFDAGVSNSTGHSNTFIGDIAGSSNTTGSLNTFIGQSAGDSNTIGEGNTFVGEGAGRYNTEGAFSSFLGCGAGYSNTTGGSNAFIGFYAGSLNTTGTNNVFMGIYAGNSNTTGSYNTFLGSYAGKSNTTAHYNVFIGYRAGYTNTTGVYNTFIGYRAGYSNTIGTSNTFLGRQAGNANSEGTSNIFIGELSGSSNTTGSANTFIGYRAGYTNTTGVSNVFIGNRAGYYETGSNKLYIENTDSTPLIYGEFDNDLVKINGDFRVAGYLSLDNGTTQIGSTELNILDGKTLVTGGSADNNKLVTKGYVDYYDDVGGGLTGGAMTDQYVCKWDDTGTQLVDSLLYENGGTVNIDGQLFINDGNYLGLTGSTNQLTVDTTAKRARFKLQADGGGTNPDDFFNFTMRNDYGDVTLSVWDDSASVWLPMLSYEYLNSKVDFKDNDIVTTGTISSGGGAYTSGGAWIEASSRDYKENITELGQSESLQALASLNPVKYNYKNKKDEEFLGFIAEDVPDLVAMNGRKGMRAMDIVAVLTKVVQDQQKVNEEYEKLLGEQSELLKKQIENLKEQNKTINELKERISELEKESQ